VVVGFVDRQSPLGRIYLRHQEESVFYRHATFYSTQEVRDLMEEVGLDGLRATQTIFGPLEGVGRKEKIREGTGEGSFVVLSGRTPT
jgi:hypothetical protein